MVTGLRRLQLLPSVDTGNGRAEKNGKEHVSSIMMTSPECLYKGYKGQKRRPPPSSECVWEEEGDSFWQSLAHK